MLLAALVLLGANSAAQQVPVGTGSVVAKVARLKPGEFVWAPEIAPAGPTLVIVNLKTQRLTLFRNGVPIAASTVSTGRKGYSTPTGVFTILQKKVEHYSSTYDNAPMPYMQRLTWGGVALHAGQLPGYPASHGCIRLPLDFAKLLYGVTKLGTTVVLTNTDTIPKVAPTPQLLSDADSFKGRNTIVDWHPERSPEGPVSVIVSASDKRAIVLRNGIVIGTAPVTVEGAVEGTWAYTLRSVDEKGQHWLRIEVDSKGSAAPVAREEWSRFRAPEAFRRAIAGVVVPGTTIVVTGDSLGSAIGPSTTLLQADPPAGTSPPRN